MAKVLITGTSKGIGYDPMLLLARAGHEVVATIRCPGASDPEKITSETKLLVTPLPLDVDDDASGGRDFPKDGRFGRRVGSFCQLPRLSGLSCSLTNCCDLSGESPDDGRFPVRPSSQIPNAAWRQSASKAGMTTVLRRRSGAHMTSLCRSQSGGPGKHASRSMTRMMQHRNA